MSLLHSDLITLITGLVSLNESDIKHITSAFEPVFITKNTVLEQEGKVTKYLYFINKGFVRTWVTDNGEDRTTQINCPSGFITSFQSFSTLVHAYDNVETITDCDLLRITKTDYDALTDKIVNWTLFIEKVLEQLLIFNEERNRDMIVLNAEERYLKLLQTRPDIAKMVPLQYIASFIGIKPESLSRIRKKLNS